MQMISEEKKTILNEEIMNLEDRRMEVLTQLLEINDKNNMDAFSLRTAPIDTRNNGSIQDQELIDLREESERLDKDIAHAKKVLDTYVSSSKKSNLSKIYHDLMSQIESYNTRIDKIKQENEEIKRSIPTTGDSSSILNEVSDQLSHFEHSFNIDAPPNQTVKERLLVVKSHLENRIVVGNFKVGNRVLFKKMTVFGGRYMIVGNRKHYFLSNDDEQTHKGRSYFQATIIYMEDLIATPENNPFNLIVGTEYHTVLVQA